MKATVLLEVICCKDPRDRDGHWLGTERCDDGCCVAQTIALYPFLETNGRDHNQHGDRR